MGNLCCVQEHKIPVTVTMSESRGEAELQGNHYTPCRVLVPNSPGETSNYCHIECREVRLDVSVLAGMLAPLLFIYLFIYYTQCHLAFNFFFILHCSHCFIRTSPTCLNGLSIKAGLKYLIS